MKTKLYNAKILTPGLVVSDGVVIINDDLIVKVCDHVCKHDCDVKYDREIDCGGNLLLPSFKNAHAHSAMTFLRSRADDLPLQEWLETQVWPQEAKLTPEHVYWFTRLAVLEYLAGGTTAAFDMYMKPDAIADAANDSGFKITMCGSLMNFDGADGVTRLRDDYERFGKSSPYVDYRLGLHAEYTNSLDNMQAVAEMSAHYKAPVCAHMSETRAEHEGCIERHGKTPAALFAELGLWEHGGSVFHAVHVTDDDIALMAQKGIYAVSCPASNLKLASGIAPLGKMENAGVKIALGTDGAASNNALSMFREMYLACVLQKYLQNDAAACPADRALEWTTINSAKAMGLKDCSCIRQGKKADLTLISLDSPAMRPHNNLVKNVVYAGDCAAVKMTMVNGEVRYKDGEFFLKDGVSAEKIAEKCESLLAELA